MTHQASEVWIPGPRGRRFAITAHARQRWDERCAHVDLTTMEHAIRFSRLIVEGKLLRKTGKAAKTGLVLFYPFDRLLFIAKRPTNTRRPERYWITTVYSVIYAPRLFGDLSRSPWSGDFTYWENAEARELRRQSRRARLKTETTISST